MAIRGEAGVSLFDIRDRFASIELDAPDPMYLRNIAKIYVAPLFIYDQDAVRYTARPLTAATSRMSDISVLSRCSQTRLESVDLD